MTTRVTASAPPLPVELEELLRKLRLPHIRRHAPEVVATAKSQRWEPVEVLKALFADTPTRERLGLAAMNSINWARVAAQIVYHASAAAAVGPCDVAVPTGNFGNILAGWIARRGGAPLQRLIIGSNSNDILTRWSRTGDLAQTGVVPTLSPSMDIQVSSNHERLLFELLGRDGAATAELMGRFRGAGAVEAPHDPSIVGASLDDRATLADPHTAVGIGAARACRAGTDPEVPVVCMATAHPAKFPDAVEQATGVHPALPAHLADLFDRPERYDVLAADYAAVRDHIRGVIGVS